MLVVFVVAVDVVVFIVERVDGRYDALFGLFVTLVLLVFERPPL